ncbi:MAG: flagellar biosynthesis protein FlhB [Lachnospiraceae bacterium]|nr:flagellar biosynthesis protein FlhB [Lachnospiraceae bacterium]
MLLYDLQLFAKEGPGGEKTEEATPKKLEDARKEGQVAKSKELAVGFTLFAMFVLLKIWVTTLGNQFLTLFKSTYNLIPTLSSQMASGDTVWYFYTYFQRLIIRLVLYMAPFILVAVAVGFTTEIIQVKWKPTAKPLQPKFNKFNPINGFKRIFSLQSLVELLKSIAKIVLIGFLVYSTVRKQWPNILILLDLPILQGIGIMGNLVLNLGLKISAFYLIISFLDFAFQKWKFKEDMKMTKQEVKDEYKQSEGDPQIKGQIRQKMMQASRRRMMQDIPKADVVITHPTHFAVAVKYDADNFDAPIVVAKGADHVAAKIKEIAKENKVEIVENKPLARMLYYNVDLGQEIPPELFKAVADILAYVYKIQGKI